MVANCTEMLSHFLLGLLLVGIIVGSGCLTYGIVVFPFPSVSFLQLVLTPLILAVLLSNIVALFGACTAWKISSKKSATRGDYNPLWMRRRQAVARSGNAVDAFKRLLKYAPLMISFILLCTVNKNFDRADESAIISPSLIIHDTLAVRNITSITMFTITPTPFLEPALVPAVLQRIPLSAQLSPAQVQAQETTTANHNTIITTSIATITTPVVLILPSNSSYDTPRPEIIGILQSIDFGCTEFTATPMSIIYTWQ